MTIEGAADRNDQLWQVMHEANSYNQPIPCKHFASRQRGGWDVCAECETDWLYVAVVNHLTESGRLLPPGGEVRTQEVWPRFGESGGGTRLVITWPDGSSYHGPIVPDPPPPPEIAQAVQERLRAIREGSQ